MATSSVIDQATTIVLNSWNGTQFAADELVTGATSGCTGRVVDFTGNNTLRLTDVIPNGNSTTVGFDGIFGTFISNTEVIAANTTRVVVQGSILDFATVKATGGDLKNSVVMFCMWRIVLLLQAK